MSVRQIHVFISHAWAYSEHYDTLQNWIFKNSWSVGQASLDFRDFSIPKNDPIHNAPNLRALQSKIFAKIALSHVVVIPTGMYANYSKWIKKELTGAQQKGKPVLAVECWGKKRHSSVVLEYADKSCGWNKDGVISSIWELYKSCS